ncbi:MAG TPA: DUF47 family protein [Syntrophomonadaceae bacterium]|nr:DUF47 family protein [Syntrophomonadaceae bacterium]
MVFKLKPQEGKFFSYFEESAQAITEAANILKMFFEGKGDAVHSLDLLNMVEERGDEIFSTTVEQINGSFITPFDREDILLLAQALNRILDHIQGTMEKIVIYKAGLPKEIYVLKMVQVLEQAADEIKNAIMKLPDIRTYHLQIIESCDKIRSWEHEGDYLYRAGIALLFEKIDNVVDIIKWKEIYEHLETTLDYCEKVSNIIKGVAVKYV